MIYQDFDLLIDKTEGGFRAQVLNSPGGQATAEFRLPFSEDKLENFLLRLGRTRRVVRRVESPEMNTAKTFGAALFNAVFTGDIKACFRSSVDEAKRQGAGLRVRLRLADPAMADLPWEFLYNPAVNRFIALSVQTPLVRYMDLPERIQPISVTPPIRVLVMIASPSDYPALDVEAEWKRLNESLGDLLASGHIAVDRLDEASLGALQRRLRKSEYHIFHFIGHGEFDQEAQEGVLILEGENERGHRVSSQYLGMLLHDHESLRVAILNACEGARTSRSDPFAGSAQSLVQQGIPAVIAMQFEIADDVASTFAHEFYGALADGYPIDAALTEARKAIFAGGREVEWGTPVLYLRAPDGRIFNVERPRSPEPRFDSERSPTPFSVIEQDQMGLAVVSRARSAFAEGRRAEALDILRRFGPPEEIVARALRELALEDERLTELERRALEDQAEKKRAADRAEATRRHELLRSHLAEAADLFARGELSAACARVCDAMQIAPGDSEAVSLEAQIRRALDEQTAQADARELEREIREEQEHARAFEREAAITRERTVVERHLQAGELDRAQEALSQADADLQPGEAFADLRAELFKLRQEARARHDRSAEEIVDRARREFAHDAGAAIALLERFSPPHPRVSAAARELKQIAADDAERARRDAEERAAEIRSRQRAAERRRDLQQALERIEGYLSRAELPEAAAALSSAESAFGSSDALQELQAHLAEAQNRVSRDRQARAAIAHARALAAAGDFASAITALDTFRPPHHEVDAVLVSIRAEAEAAEQRRDVDRRIAQALAYAHRERSHSAAIASLQEALVLDPDHPELVDALKQRRSALRAERRRAAIGSILHSRALRLSAGVVVLILLATVATVLYRTVKVPVAPASSPLTVPPAPASAPVTVAPPISQPPGDARAAGPSERTSVPEATIARGRVAGPSKPGDKPASQRGSTVAATAGRAVLVAPTGPSGAETRTRGDSGPEPTKAAAGNAAPPVPAPKPAPKPEEPASKRDETASKREEPAPPREDTSRRKPEAAATTGSPAAPVPRAPLFPTVQAAISAYADAMSRGNLAALLVVYPEAPSDVRNGVGKRGSGVKSYVISILDTDIKMEKGGTRARCECTMFHNFIPVTGKAQNITERRILILERRGDSWFLIESRKR